MPIKSTTCPLHLAAVVLLLSSCMSLELDIHLAREGRSAKLTQRLILSEGLAEFTGEPEASLWGLAITEEDFLAILTKFPQARLLSWQKKKNIVTVRLSFQNNSQLVEYLNYTDLLGRFKLEEQRLSLEIFPSPENMGYFTGQWLQLVIRGPSGLKAATHKLRGGKLSYRTDLPSLMRDGLDLSVSW